MFIYFFVFEFIGQILIVKVQCLDIGVCEFYLKFESVNLGGLIKDCIGLLMIEVVEQWGDLKLGVILVEGIVGNIGLGLVLVVQQKGYKFILVVFDKMSCEKIFNLKVMGVEVCLICLDVVKGYFEYY